MDRFEALNDAYIWGLTEQSCEPEIVTYCRHCDNELFEGEEVVVDAYGNTFCDLQCAKESHGIVSTLDDVEEKFCHCCGSELLAEDYEVYTNNDEGFFCSSDCAEQDAGFKYKTLEKEGN